MAQEKSKASVLSQQIITPVAAATPAGADVPAGSPTREQIAARAYEIFLARGDQPGHRQDDWLQAEKELRLGQH